MRCASIRSGDQWQSENASQEGSKKEHTPAFRPTLIFHVFHNAPIDFMDVRGEVLCCRMASNISQLLERVAGHWVMLNFIAKIS